jgi:hypothetical protein
LSEVHVVKHWLLTHTAPLPPQSAVRAHSTHWWLIRSQIVSGLTVQAVLFWQVLPATHLLAVHVLPGGQSLLAIVHSTHLPVAASQIGAAV